MALLSFFCHLRFSSGSGKASLRGVFVCVCVFGNEQIRCRGISPKWLRSTWSMALWSASPSTAAVPCLPVLSLSLPLSVGLFWSCILTMRLIVGGAKALIFSYFALWQKKKVSSFSCCSKLNACEVGKDVARPRYFCHWRSSLELYPHYHLVRLSYSKIPYS